MRGRAGPGAVHGLRLVGVQFDLTGHADDREDVGEVRVEPADLEPAPVHRGAAPMGVAHDAHDPASQPRDGGEVEDDPVVADGDQVHQVVTQLADMGALDQRLIDQPHHGDAAPVRDLESRPSPAGADLAALARPTSRFLVRPPQSGQVADDLLPSVGGLGLGREIEVAGDPVLEPPIERARCRSIMSGTSASGVSTRPNRGISP